MPRVKSIQPITVLTREELKFVREYAHLLTHVAISEEVIKVILLLAHVKATDICTKLPTGKELSDIAGLQRLIKVQEGIMQANRETKELIKAVGGNEAEGLSADELYNRKKILEGLKYRLQETKYEPGNISENTWLQLHYNRKSGVVTKVCSRCCEAYPLVDYALEPSSATHLKSACRYCLSAKRVKDRQEKITE